MGDASLRKAARRAYELGRLRWSARNAALVTAVVAVVALVVAGPSGLGALPLTLGLWVLAFFRGRDELRGALYGLAGGIVTASLPLSVLRPCCAPGAAMSHDCCTMPGACAASGVVVGLALAALVPYGKATYGRTALGIAAGMTSVAVVRCTTLFAGEALGLVGGLVAGVFAAAAARAVLAPAAAR